MSPYMVIAVISLIYLILGMVMEELAMVLLTVPVLFPLIVHLGFDPIWFGIYVVVIVEIGMISPPVGMNLFVILAMLKSVSTRTLYRGIIPFCIADVIRLIILIAFPAISLWLPSFMK
jgi:C4-dicarboxylate transporter, DctM subunit